MPTISKIRLINVIYEEGNKRYNDELFLFDGHNGAILLENGGGKTVFIQTALQAILPHTDLSDRKIKKTLSLENAPAHIAIEWIYHDDPRRYVTTCVSLFMSKNGLDSLRYVYEYDANDPHRIEVIPFVRGSSNGKRTADRGEMQDYYGQMRERSLHAQTFSTIKEYKSFLEKEYQIISSQWESIVKINSTEGGVETFFDDCKTTNQLFDRLLIPTVEKSIAGHEETMFADMFEKQHASFKNYKKLKETIEENKRIQQQLEGYTACFEKLHHVELNYLDTKKQAKAVWNTTIEQKQLFLDEQKELTNKLTIWTENQRKMNIKKASFKILVEKEKLNEFEKDYQQEVQTEAEIEENLVEQEKSYYSLLFAELTIKMNDEKSLLKQLEQELEKLTQDVDIQDYTAQLTEKKQQLLGYFLKKIEQLNAGKQELRYELQPLEQRRNDAKTRENELFVESQQKRDIVSQLTSRISTRKDDLHKFEQQLLANPDQETVIAELEKWKQRSQWLDEEIIRLMQEDKRLGIEAIDKEKVEEQLKEEKRELEKQITELTIKQTISKEAKEQMIAKLGQLRAQWHTIDNIYLRQQSIEATLKEQLHSKIKQKESLLFKERVAYRFVDDYLEQKQFFGDPFLEQQLQAWKNQFDFITTGVEYVQQLDEEDRLAKQAFPFWPLTLICTNKSKRELLKKLRQVEDRLLFPIVALTLEEAMAIKDVVNSNDWIAPLHWQQNLDQQSFEKWQKEIERKAQQTKNAREEIEFEIEQWQTVLKDFNQFLQTHPYEIEKQRLEKLSELTGQIEARKETITASRRSIDHIKVTQKTIQTQIVHYRDEKQGLEAKIDKGLLYAQYTNEVNDLKEKQKQEKLELEELEKSLNITSREAKRFHEECLEVEKRINELDSQIHYLQDDEAHKEIQSLTPIFSDESRKVIENKILNLNFQIRKISQSRNELEAKKQGKQQLLTIYETQRNDLKNEHPDLDETVIFPQDGAFLIHSLKEKIKVLQVDFKKQMKISEEKRSKMEEQKGKWIAAQETFIHDFPDESLVIFAEPVDEVSKVLQKETDELIERKQFLDQEKTMVSKELDAIEVAERLLEKFMEGHKFLAPDIESTHLTYEEKQQFTYNRSTTVKNITTELSTRKESVEKMKQEVAKAKQLFREFCNQKITDVKMRNMALNGVEYKTTYTDILQFKKNMMTSVERATSYANEHIRQKDLELQAFINHIHSHVQTVVEELKQIPKKTKVKVDDDWKQIYSFLIPEWQEEEGKARIREHIEWILSNLEHEQFFNDHGIEDSWKIRQEIEKWLETKQLIRIIMNNEALKVNCRKVTNDSKVTTRSYSWEQSNVWSGGEKWSKNMTLFLGILNYVAEKKQPKNAKMKRSSAVILDNPFGKASSDHVLNPVFFVAEQLGFQIIALTAHAEGKFLQDYFPVIYSCRLRASRETAKKVMTKEKWLHHAYFQDHEPKAIDRLGETEQLALFE